MSIKKVGNPCSRVKVGLKKFYRNEDGGEGGVHIESHKEGKKVFTEIPIYFDQLDPFRTPSIY